MCVVTVAHRTVYNSVLCSINHIQNTLILDQLVRTEEDNIQSLQGSMAETLKVDSQEGKSCACKDIAYLSAQYVNYIWI